MLIFNRNRAKPLANRDRHFAAGQEGRRFARQCGKVRIGERRHLTVTLTEIECAEQIETQQMPGGTKCRALAALGESRVAALSIGSETARYPTGIDAELKAAVVSRASRLLPIFLTKLRFTSEMRT